MTKDDLYDLYEKERAYQRKIFGNYNDNPALNFGTFILFLDRYISEIKKSYVDVWDRTLPSWLIECSEYNLQRTAPVKAYEDLIKLFTLAGAALEIYTNIDLSEWRSKGLKNKWMK